MSTYDPDTGEWSNEGYKAPNKQDEGEIYPEGSVDVQIIPVTPEGKTEISNPTPWNDYIPEP